MRSFISSFSAVLCRRRRRGQYACLAGSVLVVLLVSNLGAALWLRAKTAELRAEHDRLGPSTELLVVGSSHMLALHPEHFQLESVNLSHQSNSIRMIAETIRANASRTPNIEAIVFELGHVTAVGDPTRIPDHSFFEYGVSAWQFPGSWPQRTRIALNRLPVLRVPRVTPENLLLQLRPELNAAARGVEIRQQANYVDNATFRIDILRQLAENKERVADNLAALEELCDWASAGSIPMLAVLTPHDQSYRSLVGERENKLLKSQLDIVERHSNIKVLNLENGEVHGFGRHLMADADHVNHAGRARLGLLISKSLKRK